MKRNCTIFRETYAPLLCLADHIRKQVFDGLHKGRDPMKKNVFFRALPEKWGGGGLPMAEIFGPLFRSAFLVNKKSVFLQNCQCIELLTAF